jgi:hypothetical protein
MIARNNSPEIDIAHFETSDMPILRSPSTRKPAAQDLPSHPDPRHRGSSRRGAALVEFAIVSPILILFIVATIDVSAMIKVKQTLAIAGFEACRIAIVLGANDTNIELEASTILESRRVQAYAIAIQRTATPLLPDSEFVTVTIEAGTKPNLPLGGWLQAANKIRTQVTMLQAN